AALLSSSQPTCQRGVQPPSTTRPRRSGTTGRRSLRWAGLTGSLIIELFTIQEGQELFTVISCILDRELPIALRRRIQLQPNAVIEHAIHSRPEPTVDPRNHLRRRLIRRRRAERFVVC